MDPLFRLNSLNWGSDLIKLSFFDFGTIYNNYAEGNSSQRLVKKGYQLFVSSYFKDVYTSYDETTNSVFVKAR